VATLRFTLVYVSNRCKLAGHFQCRRTFDEQVFSLRCSQSTTVMKKAKKNETKTTRFASLGRYRAMGVEPSGRIQLGCISTDCLFPSTASWKKKVLQSVSSRGNYLHRRKSFSGSVWEVQGNVKSISESLEGNPAHCKGPNILRLVTKHENGLSRDDNEVPSTLLFLHELPACKTLYVRNDPNSLKAICIVTGVGWDIVKSAEFKKHLLMVPVRQVGGHFLSIKNVEW
jgi:hypothetical protein